MFLQRTLEATMAILADDCETESESCGGNCTPLPPKKSCPDHPISILEFPSDRHDTDSRDPLKDDSMDLELRRWPTMNEVMEELKQMISIGGPLVVLGLLLYARSLISMLFLGHLGELELAGGSLSIGLANITGYSVLSGLAMGMEPICGQAHGAKKWPLIGVTLQRMVLILLCASVPIAFLWVNMQRLLIWLGQERDISEMASRYILFSLPDLLIQAVLNPLRIFLRTQGIMAPLTWCAAIAVALHLPINLLLASHLNLRVEGVALAAAWTNLNLVLFLIFYLWVSGRAKKTWEGWSSESLKEWRPLLTLAIPSCLSVCLEWWWYEFMIIFSGLLINARAAVATMGILIQTTSLVYIFPSSLSMVVSTRVANELGACRPAKARISMLVALGCSIALGAMAMTFTTTMRHIWAGLFSTDRQILSLTAMAMPIVGLCELGNCPQTTGCGVLRGSARPAIGANINLGSFYLVGMPVAIFLGLVLKAGLPGLWLGLLAAQATCATLMLIVISRTNWPAEAAKAKHLIQNEDPSSPNTRIQELEMKAVSDRWPCNMETANEATTLINIQQKNESL